MKPFFKDFCLRGLTTAAGGPVVLAIVYGILGKTGVIEALSPGEVCLGVLSITLMAFIAGGITVVYTLEQLPLPMAILTHGGVLYVDYLLMYLLNDWIPKGGIGIFTLIFVFGYAAVWLVIYLSTRIKTAQINKKLHS